MPYLVDYIPCFSKCSLKQVNSDGTPLQYSCLENPMDGEAWWAAVHGVSKSWTWLSDFPFTFHFHALRRKWQPTPVFRFDPCVGKIPWRRKWQHRPVFSKITVDSDCSHEIKRCLLRGRKAMTNLDSILKSRDITLPAKVCIVKSLIIPVVMYGCESWITKKAEHWRIDAFELWCWRTLESPLGYKEI